MGIDLKSSLTAFLKNYQHPDIKLVKVTRDEFDYFAFKDSFKAEYF